MPQVIQPAAPSNGRIIISLCDFSGNWPRPFAQYGYTILHYDLKHGDDVTVHTLPDLVEKHIQVVFPLSGRDALSLVAGVLSAPPCTDFTVAGAQYWPKKDADGTTAKALAVLDACVNLSRFFESHNGAWWALENPAVGRIPTLRPELGKPLACFDPFEFAHLAVEAPSHEAIRKLANLPGACAVALERYTKKTGLWGSFNAARMREFSRLNGGPIRVCKQGSWVQKLGGKSERTKELRSMTPTGMALAFALAHV